MNFVIELWRFFRERKKMWLLPLVIFMLIFGALFIMASGSALAPFLYTLF